jgi:hypothetical protein
VAPLVPVIGGDISGRRLRWRLAGLAAACIALTAALVGLRPQPPSLITRENLDRIHVGMTRAEVETVLGLPREFRNTPANYGSMFTLGQIEGPAACRYTVVCESREGDKSVIVVHYNYRAEVIQAGRVDALDPTLGPSETLLWQVKRQLRK